MPAFRLGWRARVLIWVARRLGAGAVIHCLHHEHDIFKMGGLRKRLPVVFWTFLAGSAAIAQAQTSSTIGTGGSTAGGGSVGTVLGTGGSAAGVGGGSASTLGLGGATAGRDGASVALGTGGSAYAVGFGANRVLTVAEWGCEALLMRKLSGRRAASAGPACTDTTDCAARAPHRWCPACARAAERTAGVREALDLPEDIPTPNWERSWEVIASRSLDRAPRFWTGAAFRGWAAAAAAIVVFVLGLLAGRGLPLRSRPAPADQPAIGLLFQFVMNPRDGFTTVGMSRGATTPRHSIAPLPSSGRRGSVWSGRSGRIPRWKYAMLPARSA